MTRGTADWHPVQEAPPTNLTDRTLDTPPARQVTDGRQDKPTRSPDDVVRAEHRLREPGMGRPDVELALALGPGTPQGPTNEGSVTERSEVDIEPSGVDSLANLEANPCVIGTPTLELSAEPAGHGPHE